MEGLTIIGVLAFGFTVLGIFSAAFGADSRPWGPDEWRRL